MCPPGVLAAANGVPHVIVAAPMRSGTHLVIDLILNNFPVYRAGPLYLDLEQYRLAGLETERILSFRGSVIKTHFPHTSDLVSHKRDIAPLIERYPVIVPVRERRDVMDSMQRFGEWGTSQSTEEQFDAFEECWRGVPRLSIPFDQLVDPAALSATVSALATHLGAEPSASLVGPRPQSQRRRVLFDKVLTRLFGPAAPRINTTIGFALPSPKSPAASQQEVSR